MSEFFVFIARKKLAKYPNLLCYLHEKITKIAKFHMIFLKYAQILHNNNRKKL